LVGLGGIVFVEKKTDETLDEYLIYLLAATRNASINDIEEAVPETVKKGQFKALIEKLESGDFDVLVENMKINVPKMVNAIKAGIGEKETTDSRTIVKELVDELLAGKSERFFELLENEKKNRNLTRFKRRNQDEINRVIEYARDEPEIREKLESEYPAIFGFVEMTLTSPDNLSVLKYFRKLSQANLTVREKKYAIAPPTTSEKSAVAKTKFTGKDVFTVTPSFEYFMRQNSLGVEKIPTKKPKTSFQLDIVLNDINKNNLDKYGDLKIDLEDIGEKLTEVELPKKLAQLKRLMDKDVEIFDTINSAMSMIVREDRLKLPKDDVFVIAYPNEEEYDEDSDNFKNFANKYFDGDEDEAYDFVEDNTGKLDMIRDRNYRSDEIIIPEGIKSIFESLMTMEEFNPKESLAASVAAKGKFDDDKFKRNLNDLVFSNENNIADYLETISLISRSYAKNFKLRDINEKYIKGDVEYEKLIELYEKEFKDVKDKFIDMIGERVQELSKTRDTLSEKIRPVIQEVFGE
tara:strand:- start:1072 stop:2634 length:1563 start_codon:yes stop_codon:yes gene_type:complete